MAGYALLLQPSANRVYSDSAGGLARAELDLFSRAALDGSIRQIAQTTIGGVGYITFEAGALDDGAVAFLSNLSSGYALFERLGHLLRPVGLRPGDRYDDDLITIQKYQGKTNEQFTKLLLNVTVLSSASAAGMLTRKLTVLDPLCGRGTTLNQALMYGYDAAGIDLDRQDFDAYRAFLRTWLQRKRLKHHVEYDGRYAGTARPPPADCRWCSRRPRTRGGLAPRSCWTLSTRTPSGPRSSSAPAARTCWSRTRRTGCGTAAGPRRGV